jgi:hypothetical protein
MQSSFGGTSQSRKILHNTEQDRQAGAMEGRSLQSVHAKIERAKTVEADY